VLRIIEVCISFPKSYFPQSHNCLPPSLSVPSAPSFANGAPRLGFCAIVSLSCPTRWRIHDELWPPPKAGRQ
jgi:hypothetical protein